MKYLSRSIQPERAPELYGDFWFNAEPIALQALQKQPALIFFWDYTSGHSRRMLPFINALYALYQEYGVVFIGVHAPEFFFGKDIAKVEKAIQENLIVFPVLTDNDRFVTNAYRISSIPSICLIDHRGNIYDTIEENFFPERIERSIQFLLKQSGYYGELPLLMNPEYENEYHQIEKITKEIPVGYRHGALGNPEGYNPEMPGIYDDPGVYIPGKFYLHGNWFAGKSNIEYLGNNDGGYILMQTEGESMKMIASSANKTLVDIEWNGMAVPTERAGNDLILHRSHKSSGVQVKDAMLYDILRFQRNDTGMVKLIPSTTGVMFFQFSFDASPHSPLLTDANENNDAL